MGEQPNRISLTIRDGRVGLDGNFNAAGLAMMGELIPHLVAVLNVIDRERVATLPQRTEA